MSQQVVGWIVLSLLLIGFIGNVVELMIASDGWGSRDPQLRHAWQWRLFQGLSRLAVLMALITAVVHALD